MFRKKKYIQLICITIKNEKWKIGSPWLKATTAGKA